MSLSFSWIGSWSHCPKAKECLLTMWFNTDTHLTYRDETLLYLLHIPFVLLITCQKISLISFIEYRCINGYLHNFNISITSVCRVKEVICYITQLWLQNFISFTASYLQKIFIICHHLFDKILLTYHVNYTIFKNYLQQSVSFQGFLHHATHHNYAGC